MNETKVRILDAAERLIAEHGLDVSLRTITAEAGVNLAAVNYHFQSKDALVEALVCRRFDDVNSRRLELLDVIEARHPEGALPLEPVIEAFLGPVLELKRQAPAHHRQLMGRLFTLPEDLIRRIFESQMKPVVTRFSIAFRRAVPHLAPAEISWRMILSIGAVVHLMSWSKVLPVVSNGLLTLDGSDRPLREIVQFCAAGFRAPAQSSQGESQ